MKRDRKEYFHQYSVKIREKKKLYDKKRYEEKKEEIQRKSRERYHRTKEKFKDRKIKYLESNLESALFRSAKARAKLKNIEFLLEKDDIVIPEYCPYLGTPLTRCRGEGAIWTNPSVDRINNKLGYVKTNIEIISRKANVMKQDATIEELIAFAIGVLKKHKPDSLK